MLKLIELFSGIGAQAKALENLGVEFVSHRTCEWEVNAVKSYKEIHFSDVGLVDTLEENDKDFLVNTLFEMGVSSDGKKPMTKEQIARKSEQWLSEVYKDIKITNDMVDITKVHAEDLDINSEDTYLMTYSFPCQDLSIAGKGKGMEKGSGTRSGLLWEVERILQECEIKPKFLLMENVTQVHGKKHIDDFEDWLKSLESMGYSNYYQDLNAKNYGVPQNRNRCFMLSVLDDTRTFEFPEEKELKTRLKDILEGDVDDKYYLEGLQSYFIQHSFESEEKGNGFRFEPHVKKNADIDKAITTHAGSRMDDNFVVDIECEDSKFKFDSTNKLFHVGDLDIGNNDSINRVYDPKGLCPTIQTMQGGNRQPKIIEQDLKIRKLTPKECWRLMGFSDEDFDKAEKVNSNTQLYKQAGNSIVVNVLEAIFGKMIETYPEYFEKKFMWDEEL